MDSKIIGSADGELNPRTPEGLSLPAAYFQPPVTRLPPFGDAPAARSVTRLPPLGDAPAARSVTRLPPVGDAPAARPVTGSRPGGQADARMQVSGPALHLPSLALSDTIS